MVDGSEQCVLPGCSRLHQKGIIGPDRAKCALQVRSRGPIDGRVALDVVAFCDRRRGVAEEGCRRVASHPPGDDRGARASVPAEADSGVTETGLDQEVPERAPDVVRAQRTAPAAGEDRPGLLDADGASPQDTGRRCRSRPRPSRSGGRRDRTGGAPAPRRCAWRFPGAPR